MRIIFILFFIFLQNLYAGEDLRCKFEEVYKDGSIQNGFLLTKNNLLRYQYINKSLFTIFFNSKNFFYVRNDNHTIVQKIDQNTELLRIISVFFSSFPNTDDHYYLEGFDIKLEKNAYNNFYKRISVKSEKMNLSIYFSECEDLNLSQTLFNFSPYIEYQY